MPPYVTLIINGITAAIGAAPQVIAIIQKGKDLIAALFGAKLITAEQQNALHAHIDAVCAAIKRGEKPPAWEVEDDPTDE